MAERGRAVSESGGAGTERHGHPGPSRFITHTLPRPASRSTSGTAAAAMPPRVASEDGAVCLAEGEYFRPRVSEATLPSDSTPFHPVPARALRGLGALGPAWRLHGACMAIAGLRLSAQRHSRGAAGVLHDCELAELKRPGTRHTLACSHAAAACGPHRDPAPGMGEARANQNRKGKRKRAVPAETK